MALNLYTTYSGNIETGDETNYPIGKARNETSPGLKDWFPLEATWINEILGFLGAILEAAGYSPDGNAEVAGASQYLNGIRALDVSLNRLITGYTYIDLGTMALGTTALGRVQIAATPAQTPLISSTAPNTKSEVHTVALRGGTIRYSNQPGVSHNAGSIYNAIDIGDVTVISGSPDYVQIFKVGAIDIPGIEYCQVYQTNLVLVDTPGYIRRTIPIDCTWISKSGTLALSIATAPIITSLTVGDYNYAYLHMWLDSSFIS
jgi:hypothetical protein